MQPALLEKLRGIVGSEHLLTGEEASPYALEGCTPAVAVFPGSAEEIASVLTLASREGVPVTPWGGGTKMGVGSPPKELGIILGLRRLDRVLEHEPGDLTATFQAGITLERLRAALGTRGQWLPLDPPFGERATLGGILAANASGPRRHLYGTARDLLIGIRVVSADGSVVRGGGKVVKNVAGYDLPKLYIGSFGTLGVIVEATVKLRPLPEDDRLTVTCFERLAECGQAVRLVLTSDLIPSAVDFLDGEAVQSLGLGPRAGVAGAVLLGFDGSEERVRWQCEEARRVMSGAGRGEHRVLAGRAREEAWRGVREMDHRVFPERATVVKFTVPPTEVVSVIERARAIARGHGLRAAFGAHAGVGVVRGVLALSGGAAMPAVATLKEWRDLARAVGGQAMVVQAPVAVKEQVAVWDDPGPAVRLMERIKARLDPAGILNPGRFVGGI